MPFDAMRVECSKCGSHVPSNQSTLRANGGGLAICTSCCSSDHHPPTVDIFDVIGQFAAKPDSPPFIECIGLVQFDLQLGQVLDYLCPPMSFCVAQETEIAFLCFPDANHVGDGDSFHDFVYAFNASEMDPARASVKREHPLTRPSGGGFTSPNSQSPRRRSLNSATGLRTADTVSQDSEDRDVDSNSSSRLASRSSPASGGLNGPRKLPYDATMRTLFCSTMFRQRRDSSVERGAQQKSLLVMSQYPFPALFHRVLQVLCVGLFDARSDPETLLRTACDEIRLWPRPLPGREYPILPLLGHVLQFVTPIYDPFDMTPASWSIADPCIEVTVHDETALERLRCVCESVERPNKAVAEAICDYLAVTPSVPIEVSNWLEASGWSYSLKSFAPPAENAPFSSRITLAELLRARPNSNHIGRPIPDVKKEAPETLIALFDTGTQLSREALSLQNRALESLLFDADRVLATLISDNSILCTKSNSRQLLSEIDVHAALFTHITKAWKLWELAMTGESIAFVGPSAPIVSAMCLSVAAIIAPLHWKGLLRPYFTINNREIDLGVDRHPHGPTMVGTTNPFFIRHLEAWPHMVCVSQEMQQPTTHKMWPSNSPKRTKQQFKLKNRMFCSRHYLIKTDKTWGDEVSSVIPEHNQHSSFVNVAEPGKSSKASRIVRNTFVSLTLEFLSPLTMFISSVMQRHQPYFLSDAQLRTLLSHRAAMEFISTSSHAVLQRFKGPKEALETYEAFYLSPTGQFWLQSQIRIHYRRFLLEDVKSLEDVVRITPCRADRLGTLSRLQWDLERCIDAPCLDVPLLRKLTSLCRQVMGLRDALVSELI